MVTGTARDNCVGRAPLTSSKVMNGKKTPRGHYEDYSCNGYVVVRWKENKIVPVLSNDMGVLPEKKVCKYDKEA